MGNIYTTYSDDNKLDINYEPGSPIFTGFTAKIDDVWNKQIQTITIETYQYFGMTESVAKNAADTIIGSTTSTPAKSTTYAARATRQGNSTLWNVNVTKTIIELTWETIS